MRERERRRWGEIRRGGGGWSEERETQEKKRNFVTPPDDELRVFAERYSIQYSGYYIVYLADII